MEPTTKKQSWFKRHKVLTAIGVGFIVIAFFANLGTPPATYETTNNSKETVQQPEKKKDSEAKIGDTVRDGKLEFVVKSLDCGIPSVGNEYMNRTAQGQYCKINVSVKNIGNEAQSMFASNQKLKNATGQEYSADDTATIYASPNADSWYSNINPGNTVEGDIYFDLPKDATPVLAELHDSSFSGGVSVRLQ